jgi:RNase P subunit RPR2
MAKQGRFDMFYCRKVCREESLRMDASMADEQGITVSHFRNVSGLHALCVCPECGKRARYLYRPPIVHAWNKTNLHLLPHAKFWACGACHGLVYRSSQRSGTVAKMKESEARDRAEFERLFPGGGENFADWQKWKNRSYNRKKAGNRFQFGKVA